jgi:hypothetical protein
MTCTITSARAIRRLRFVLASMASAALAALGVY